MLPRRRLLMLAPIGALATADAGFWLLRRRPDIVEFGPHGVSSPLLGRRLPGFSLPGLANTRGFSSLDVIQARRPVVLNFFASWCEPCHEEMPILLRLARSGAAIWGIDFKDRSSQAEAFLRGAGDPYRRIASDDDGDVARQFGLEGVPESFLVDETGVVRWRWVGALTADVVREQLEPLLGPPPAAVRV